MKKFVSVLFIFLISSYSVFCDLEYTEDSPMAFSLGLSLTTDKYSYEIGFSSKEVSENSVTPGSIQGNELELYSQLSDNSKVYAERGSGIFVYWKIASNENVKISLGLEKPLTYDPGIEGESPSTIDWYASWEGDTPGSIGGDGRYVEDGGFYDEIHIHNASLDSVDISSVGLKISTDKLNNPALYYAQRYEAKMLIKVEAI